MLAYRRLRNYTESAHVFLKKRTVAGLRFLLFYPETLTAGREFHPALKFLSYLLYYKCITVATVFLPFFPCRKKPKKIVDIAHHKCYNICQPRAYGYKCRKKRLPELGSEQGWRRCKICTQLSKPAENSTRFPRVT